MSESPTSPPPRARRSARLVPGVIYEWTPHSTVPFDRVIEPPPISRRLRLTRPTPGAEMPAGYRLIERLGESVTGEVWRASGPGETPVTLKFIESGHPVSGQEIRSLAAAQPVRHPNLATMRPIGNHEGWTVIEMDLPEESLLERFEAAIRAGRAGLDRDDLIRSLRQASRGIDFLNATREDAPALIHRAIEPANLVRIGGVVQVGDFGLATPLAADASDPARPGDDRFESSITAYSPPEMRRGGVALQSDQYALAATYCHLRGGHPPQATLDPDSGIDVAGLTMIPPAERPVVARALATDPRERWSSCASFVDALAAATEHPVPRVVPDVRGLSEPAAPRARRQTSPRSQRVAEWVAMAIMGLFVIGFSALVWPEDSSTSLPELALHPARMQVPQPDRSDAPTISTRPMIETVALSPPEEPPPPVAAELVPLPAATFDAPSPPELAGEPPVPPPPAVEAEASSPPAITELVEVEAPPAPVGDDDEPTWSGVEIRAALEGWTKSFRERWEPRIALSQSLVLDWIAAHPRPVPPPRPITPPPARTATITVQMPGPRAELVVRGEVGRGNPEEWYGPRRVIHSPPFVAPTEYLIGAFWFDPSGQPSTRSITLKVEPGRRYEVDLRAEPPATSEVSLSPRS